MSDAIKTQLQTLVENNHSEYTSDITVTRGPGQIYDIHLGEKMGTFHDMVRVNRYLSGAGLSPNNLDPFAEYGIVTKKGHTPLGYGDGKGGFHDEAQLSDNVIGMAALGRGFGLRLNLDGFSEKDIEKNVAKAIQLQKMDHHLSESRKAGETQFKDRLRNLDATRDKIADVESFKRRRSEAENIKIVTTFITDTVRELATSAEVTVQYSRDPDRETQMVYNLSKPNFHFHVTLNDPSMDNEAFSQQLNERVREKIPYHPNLPVSGINTFRGQGNMEGDLTGSAARLAAQIEGVKLSISR
jgi:hypothetical protein